MTLKEDIIIKKEKWLVIALLFLYSTLLMFFSSAFSPLFGFNEWADVNIYFNIGRAITNGAVLYRDVFDHKGPVIFFIYGVAAFLSKNSFWGAYVVQVALFFTLLLSIYKTACLYLNKTTALFASLIFSYFPLIYNANGGCAEEFTLPFFAVSFYFLLKYLKTGDPHKPLWMLIHGAMASIIFLIKLNLVAFWIFVPFILINILCKKEYHLAIRNALAFGIGCLLVLLPIFIYFLLTGALEDFWNAYINFNLLYGSVQLDQNLYERLLQRSSNFIRNGYIYAAPIIVGLVMFTVSKKHVCNWGMKCILILTCIAMFCSIFMSSFILTYYYLPISIFIILGIVSVLAFLPKLITNVKFPQGYAISIILAILLVSANAYKKKEILKPSSGTGVINSFAEEIGKGDESTPTLLTLGLDYGIDVYVKAKILPSVKYFFTPNIAKEIYPTIHDEQKAYIDNKTTDYIIIHSTYRDYESVYPSLCANYEIIKTYPWGEQAYYLYKKKS